MKYTIKKSYYLLISLFFIINSSYCQENNKQSDKVILNGVVFVDNGNSYAEVLITEKGMPNNCTTTDMDGNFKLKVNKGAIISVSFIGMETKEFDTKGFSEVRLNIMKGLIEFCCDNHNPSHCASTIDEMSKLTKKYNCSFK